MVYSCQRPQCENQLPICRRINIMKFQIDEQFLIDCFKELVEVPSPVGYDVHLKPVLERFAAQGEIISASRIRSLIRENRIEALEGLLPQSSLRRIHARKGEAPCHIPTECKET